MARAGRTRAYVGAGMLAVAIAVAGCSPTVTPQPARAGGISCVGGVGAIGVTPGLSMRPAPVSLTLLAPASSGGCDDRSGAGIDGVVVEEMTASFASFECLPPAGTTGSGIARLRWSNGTTSEVALEMTMDSALSGSVRMRVTSGPFVGLSGTSGLSTWPSEGSCYEGGITAATVQLQRIALAGD